MGPDCEMCGKNCGECLCHVDWDAAKREAQRIIREFPLLVQPCMTSWNLARAYLAYEAGNVPPPGSGE